MSPPRGSRVALFALTVAAILFLCALGLGRRFAATAEYRNFAGDGWQYYRIAESLVNRHQYAFGPGLPPANSRLPGFPILIALVGHNVVNFAADQVSFQVTRAHAWLDLLTALVAFFLARELGWKTPPWLALGLCLASPFLILCTGYVLTETPAILLTTTTLWLLVRASRRRLALHLALAGALAGLGMLVRADAATLLPCFLVPLLFSPAPRREKLRAAILSAAIALAVWAPWPVRNLVRFHRLYPAGSQWVTKQGDPLPTGIQAWLRTWAEAPYDATVNVAWRVTRGDPLAVELLPADAFDTAAEKRETVRLFGEYNRHGLTPTVDEDFRKLAAARRDRSPARYYVRLPLARAARLWREPVPEWELPFLSPTLHFPQLRPELATLNERTLLIALLGFVIACLAAAGRPLAMLVALAAVTRTAAIAFVVPGGTQRYLLELLPSVLVLAAVGLCGPAELILARLAAGARDAAGSRARSTTPRR